MLLFYHKLCFGMYLCIFDKDKIICYMQDYPDFMGSSVVFLNSHCEVARAVKTI